jgi:hypothetical protein
MFRDFLPRRVWLAARMEAALVRPTFSLAADDIARAARSYGRNAERLIQAKRHYDPDNVFASAIPLPITAMASESATIV